MKKIHMYTKEKGVSCGKRMKSKGNVVNSNLRTTNDPSMVTCIACLNKIANEKTWTSRKGMFITGYALRIIKDSNGQWEIIFYMNGYKVGNILKKDGGKTYTTPGRAIYSAECFKSSINSNTLKIVID